MPTYNFRNKDTGEEFTEFMSMSEVDKYLNENPNYEQLVTAPAIVSGVSGKKPDSSFRDILKDMKRNHRSKAINTF